MKFFKVIFPSGYQVVDELNDNIDLNIVLENDDVFFASFFTPINIQTLMEKEEYNYFWATDMIVVKNLGKNTIREAISKIIQDGYLEIILTKIGKSRKVFSNNMPFDQIIDML